MKHILIIFLFISGQMVAQGYTISTALYTGEVLGVSTFPKKPIKDTTLVKLGHVKDKKTIVTETEIIGDVEVIKRETYDKARAESRIEELNRQIESDSLMMEQYITMLDQIRQEIIKTRKKTRQNELIRERLIKIMDQL